MLLLWLYKRSSVYFWSKKYKIVTRLCIQREPQRVLWARYCSVSIIFYRIKVLFTLHQLIVRFAWTYIYVHVCISLFRIFCFVFWRPILKLFRNMVSSYHFKIFVASFDGTHTRVGSDVVGDFCWNSIRYVRFARMKLLEVPTETDCE